MRGLWTHLERLAGGGMAADRDQGPGRVPDRDRPPAGARPDRGAAAAARARRAQPRGDAGPRASRRLPTVALAGYTNAGKSTLLNALTDAGVGVGERLFHTLDPTTRAFEHGGRRYLLTDTVGFIRKLPHQLVEAFKATLEETVLADLILHVVDGSEPEEQRREAIAAVDAVLEEIGAGETPRLLVFNKIDLLDDDERRELPVRDPEAIARLGRDRRGDRRAARPDRGAVREHASTEVELLYPTGQGERLSRAPRGRGRPRARGTRGRRLRPCARPGRPR